MWLVFVKDSFLVKGSLTSETAIVSVHCWSSQFLDSIKVIVLHLMFVLQSENDEQTVDFGGFDGDPSNRTYRKINVGLQRGNLRQCSEQVHVNAELQMRPRNVYLL